MTRLTFGQDLPCPQCHLTGQVRAPAMSQQEVRERARENKRRHAAKLEPLEKPDVMITCPRCGGTGVEVRVVKL